MNIGLDFDDVIARTHELKPFVAELLYGVRIAPEDFRREFVVGKGILTDEQYKMVGREVFSGKYEMEEVPEAALHLRLLAESGHSLRIVTNRSDEWRTLEPARRWLKRRALDIPISGLVYGSSKAPLCRGLDLFVDDDPPKLAELEGVVAHRLLFRWPHSEHEAMPRGASPVRSWRDICRYVESLG